MSEKPAEQYQTGMPGRQPLREVRDSVLPDRTNSPFRDAEGDHVAQSLGFETRDRSRPKTAEADMVHSSDYDERAELQFYPGQCAIVLECAMARDCVGLAIGSTLTTPTSDTIATQIGNVLEDAKKERERNGYTVEDGALSIYFRLAY